MHVTQYARQSVAAGVLALALAACGKGTGPSEFNAQGTSADMAVAEDAFASQQTSSFSAVGTDISAVLNGSPVVAGAAELMLTRPSALSARYARRLAALVPSASRGIQASVAAVPSAVLGKTFVWDVTNDVYVASDLPGAPTSGVRFMLYAVDPVALRPVEPVVEVGYVDVTDHSTSTAVDVGVRVVEGSVVYLNYDLKATATATGGLITVSGFVSNGTTVATFNLKNTFSANAGSPVFSFDYQLDVPSRHLSLAWTATIASISSTESVITLDLAVSGQNGNVRITGTSGVGGGSLSVKVNGDLLATVNLDNVDPVVTGAGGAPLTPEEEASVQAIFGFYFGASQVFDSLLFPVS